MLLTLGKAVGLLALLAAGLLAMATAHSQASINQGSSQPSGLAPGGEAALPAPTGLARTIPQDGAPTAIVSDPVTPSSIQAVRPPAASPSTWAESTRETGLFSGPVDNSVRFNLVQAGSLFKSLSAGPEWTLVAYGGDVNGRLPGQAWVRAADLGAVSQEPKWGRAYRPTNLGSSVERGSPALTDLPHWSLLELWGPAANGRMLVAFSGDGRARQAGRGWVGIEDLVPVGPPTGAQLPWAYSALVRGEAFRLLVPYRSQLDGSSYEDANCGPTTLGMALESLGINLSSAELRARVLAAQEVWGHDVGSYIWALAAVAESVGLKTPGLYHGQSYRSWTVNDVREHVRAGHPVIPQVRFRALPGRADASYPGDHYIVVTGLLGEDFLYHDSVDSDGIGYDRVISAAQLARAMDASDRQFAYTAFAVAR